MPDADDSLYLRWPDPGAQRPSGIAWVSQQSIRDDPRVGEFTLDRQIGPYQLYFVDSSPTTAAACL